MKVIDNSFSGACARSFGGRKPSCAPPRAEGEILTPSRPVRLESGSRGLRLQPERQGARIPAVPDMRGLRQSNAFEACDSGGPHAFRRAFYEANRGPHSALQHVDAFVCNHPPVTLRLEASPCLSCLAAAVSPLPSRSRSNLSRPSARSPASQALCELYMPFNKSIMVVASVNLEFGRENPPRWAEWIASLRMIASTPRNVVAANNWYDTVLAHT